MTFAYYTGWRMASEILKLTWSQVDFEAGTVRLEAHTTKNEEARPIYLPQILVDLLEQQWQEHLTHYSDCPLVFHNHGNHIINYRPARLRACQEAGIHGKIPHDFRRTAVRNLGESGGYRSGWQWLSPAIKPAPCLRGTISSMMGTSRKPIGSSKTRLPTKQLPF
jgi:integrase